MACTLVTAYYSIRSKFPKEQYVSWITTFLKIKSPIVVFTDQNMVEWIREKRGELPIHIVAIPFNDLEMWKRYELQWNQQYMLDPEQFRHSPELYAIWAQKPFFVEQAIQLNPFQTDYFFWCDIGAFRDPSISQTILDTFPHTQYLDVERIVLQSVENLAPSDWGVRDDGIRGEKISSSWNECRIVGGLWGGGKNACLRWKHAYQHMLERYFHAGRFAGKDQQVMLSTYLHDPSLAKIVMPTQCHGDWFFLQKLLSKEHTLFSLNPTYFA
jgi:Bacterial protein of unknown function (HtrL_YibB)